MKRCGSFFVDHVFCWRKIFSFHWPLCMLESLTNGVFLQTNRNCYEWRLLDGNQTREGGETFSEVGGLYTPLPLWMPSFLQHVDILDHVFDSVRPSSKAVSTLLAFPTPKYSCGPGSFEHGLAVEWYRRQKSKELWEELVLVSLHPSPEAGDELPELWRLA